MEHSTESVAYPDAGILVFAKAPLAGQVKTRLIPRLGVDGATRLYRGLLRYQLERLSRAGLASVELWCAPDSNHPEFLSLQRELGFALCRQQGSDLGERMAMAVAHGLQRHRYVLLLGIDSPALTLYMIEQALDWLAEGQDAVLGPAEDGGYVLLGLRRSADCLFRAIPWGGERVAELTRQCLHRLDWQWCELSTTWDLDRPDDLARLANLAWKGCLATDQALPNELADWLERASPDGP